MCAQVRYKSFQQLTFTDLLVYSKLPKHPFWSNVGELIDFSFADRLCEVLYSGRGQYPYAPSLKLKIHLVQVYYSISDRLVEEKIMGDLFIKRFLGLPVEFFGFDHSTIGLDRSRMGEEMFRACHFYILAQLYSRGLWGDKNEQWIIDSFPANISMTRHGAFRLIQRAMIRIVQHMKRHAPNAVQRASQSLQLDAMMTRLNAQSSSSEQMLAFSKLVAQAYGLLHWFENDNVIPLLEKWRNYNVSQELQAILRRVLAENSRPHDTNGESGTEEPESIRGASDDKQDPVPTQDEASEQQPPVAVSDAIAAESPSTPASASSDVMGGPSADQVTSSEVLYEKIPRKERPSDRIENVFVPDARTGVKKKSTVIIGFKVQNLCTDCGIILNAQAVPANEHDRDAMAEMVATVHDFFRVKPQELLGDTAYGHGKQRVALASQGVRIVAPVQESTNPTNLFNISSFTYDPDRDLFTCPNGAESIKKYVNDKLEGSQYYFGKENCADCPLRAKCTTNAGGRTVFRSNYADLYAEAKTFNESVMGQESLKKRSLVERKNNELKNDCGLGETSIKSRSSLQIKALLAAIVVNLKHTVRIQRNPKPGFLRREKTA